MKTKLKIKSLWLVGIALGSIMKLHATGCYDLSNVPQPNLLPGAVNWCLSNPAPTVTVANHSTISAIPQFLGYVWIVAGPSYYQVVQQGPSPSHTLTPHPVIPGLQLIVKIALQGDGTPSCPNDTSKSSRIFIYLDTMPPVPLLSGPVQTCFNQAPFTFQVLNHSTISGHPGFIGYTWSLNGSSLGSTGTSPTYTFAHGLPAGQHSIIVNAVFNSLCAAAKSDTMLFKIDTFLTPIDMLPPPALVSNPQVPFCYTYPPSVTVSISNAAIIQSNPLFVGFSWEVNGVFQAGASGPTLTISNPQVDMTVRAYAIYRNTCGKDSIFGRTYLYLFNPPFPAPYLGETLIYCDPDSTTHYVFNHAAVSSAPGFLGYLWFMNGQYQGASVGPSFTIYNPPHGVNVIQAYAIFQHVCGIDTTSGLTYIHVGLPPQAKIYVNGVQYYNNDTVHVTGPTQIVFSASSNVQGSYHFWALQLPGNTGPLTNQNGMGPTFTSFLDSNGVYRILLSTTNYSACPQNDTIYVHHKKVPASLASPTLHAQIYPNPTSGRLTISVPDATMYILSVRDMQGREVHATTIQGPEATLTLSLPDGVYEMILSGESGIGTARLVIAE